MRKKYWHITAEYGFLASQAVDAQHILLNDLLSNLKVNQFVTKNQSILTILAEVDLKSNLNDTIDVINNHANSDSEARDEALFMIYGYLASALVGMGYTHIPATISVPLANLAKKVGRPPMLGYAGMVLNNWRLKDEALGFVPENIALGLRITDLIDESWFFRVHIAIEAQSGAMLQAMIDVQEAITQKDNNEVFKCVRTMHSGLVQITKTFHEMTKLCDPDIYYQRVRPYLMSFDKTIIFEGVSPNPTPLRGGSGAQSSIVPAMLAGLGIAHQESELTANLQDMRRYMPREHRDFIQQMYQSKLRDYCKIHAPLRDAYNNVLRQLITFRRAHLYYARTYIFEKSTNPVGTGGTEYMSFLSKLIDETANQML